MKIQNIHETQVLGASLVLLGLSIGGAAAVAGVLAAEHMALVPAMCGPAAGHCLRCVGAAALLAASLGVSGTGISLLRWHSPVRRPAGV